MRLGSTALLCNIDIDLEQFHTFTHACSKELDSSALNHNIECDLLYVWSTGKSTMHVLNNTFVSDCRCYASATFQKDNDIYIEAVDQTGFCAVGFGFCKMMSGDY